MLTNEKVTFDQVSAISDSNARSGQLRVNGYTIKTPIVWFGHNFNRPICVWENIRQESFKVLVNACEIIRKPYLAEAICKKSIRHYLGYKGPVMMDSGGFLFQKHHEINISPAMIINLYERANIDVGVTLDHPFDPLLPDFENRKRWKLTLRNTEYMASRSKSYAFMPVVHGYTLNSLKSACKQIRGILGNPSLLGIGSFVPLMKGSYLGGRFRYKREDGRIGDHVSYIADALMLIRDEFSKSLIHVFGAGGATTILSLFALGADSVDSVAWRLKAAYGAIQLPGISDRFLSPRPNSLKTRKIVDGDELNILRSCICPVCSRYKRVGWQKRKLDSSFKARCIHNAWVLRKEAKAFKKAILAGKTNDFLKRRLAKTHRFFDLILRENGTVNRYG